MRKKKGKDYTGKRFGKLVAARPTEKRKYKGSVVWEFKCDCGNTCYKAVQQLSNVSSCGCETKKIYANNGKKSIKYLNKDCTHETKIANLLSKKVRSDNTSGVRGVYFYKKGNVWRASITFQKKNYHLGYYKNKEDAIKVRKEAEEMLFDPFLEWYEEIKKLPGL